MNPSFFFDVEDVGFDFGKEQTRFIDNMNMIRDLSVQESTLYKKWVECQDYKDRYDSSCVTKSHIWVPKDIFNKESTLAELKALKPVIELVESENQIDEWLNLRVFCHSMEYEMTPGRMLRFTIKDDVTGKYLGAVSLSSDVTRIQVRDKYIGWNDTNKFDEGKLRCTSIASCIMSTQPFGYNFLGGKLIATLLMAPSVREAWKEKYGDVLVGLTTTSLYGPESMYNGIPYWKNLGVSTGRIYIKPDDSVYTMWHQYVKEHKKEEYEKAAVRPNGDPMPVSGIKQRILNLIFRVVEIKPTHYMHGFQRGIYFAPFYENTKEYLTSQIQEDQLNLRGRMKAGVGGILAWWRPKAESRYLKLLEEKRVKPDILYYNKLAFMSWEETKQQYLKDVGR